MPGDSENVSDMLESRRHVGEPARRAPTTTMLVSSSAMVASSRMSCECWILAWSARKSEAPMPRPHTTHMAGKTNQTSSHLGAKGDDDLLELGACRRDVACRQQHLLVHGKGDHGVGIRRDTGLPCAGVAPRQQALLLVGTGSARPRGWPLRQGRAHGLGDNRLRVFDVCIQHGNFVSGLVALCAGSWSHRSKAEKTCV